MATATSSTMDSVKVLVLGSKFITKNIKWSVIMLFVQLSELIKYVTENIKSADTFVLVVPGSIIKEMLRDSIFTIGQVRHIYIYYDNDDDFERDKNQIEDEHGNLRFWHERNLETLLEKLEVDHAINTSSLGYRAAVNDVASSWEQRISAKRSNDADRHSPSPKRFAPTSKQRFSVKHIEQIDSKYICSSCKFLFCNPYQLECGHRICQSCIKNDNNQTTCFTCLQTSLNQNIWHDKGFHSEMLPLPISCSLCDWTGSFESYQKHIDQKHPDGENSATIMDVYTQQTNQRRLSESVYTIETHEQSMSDSLTHSRSIDLPNNSYIINDPYHILVTHLPDMIRAISNRVNIVSKDQQRLDVEVRHSQNLLHIVNQNLLLIKESSQDIVSRARGLKNSEDLLAQQIRPLEQAVHDPLFTSFDGTYIWKITGVHEKLVDARSERQKSIYSSPFYSSPTGYKMCLRLYLNGDGDTRNEYLSLFLVVMRGDYDAILKWPFPYRVSFRLIDQSTPSDNQGDIIHSFWPHTTSDCFKRPVYDMNHGYGFKEFLSIAQFEQNQSLYVKDDTMFIEAKIDFISKKPVLSSISSIGESPNDEEHVNTISENFTHMC